MTTNIYYTYIIYNKANKMMYIGSRHSHTENPYDDLGILYFSSSRNKDFITDQKSNPQKYIYKILKIFNDPYEMITHESFLHKKFNVANNARFYNQSNACISSFTLNKSGKEHPCYGLVWVNNYITEKKIYKDELDYWLENGWKRGRSHQSIEKNRINNIGKQIGSKNKSYNKKWLTKDGKTIYVQKDKVDEYLAEGWVLGISDSRKEKIKHLSGEFHPLYGKPGSAYGKKWVHIGNNRTYVPIEKLDEYLNNGWELGMGKIATSH